MTEPLAFLNGNFIPVSELKVPVWDVGFVQGVTVAEQLRTFGGRLFRLERHLQRLRDSLTIVGVDLRELLPKLPEIADRIVRTNYGLIAAGDDLGLSVFVTPGVYGPFAVGDHTGPTIGLHTYPVAFATFAAKYESGERLVISRTRQVPETCWPSQLKCRSRMHYFLADREARKRDPHARALLLDQTGHISEASTANFLLYQRESGFLSPPKEKILPGISVAVLEELATKNGERFQFRELNEEDIQKSDEAFLCSTSPCLLPVVSVNGQPIGDGRPGPVFLKMISAWSELVGVNVIEQATRFANR